MATDYLKGLEFVGDYAPPAKRKSVFDELEYVRDVPTVTGQIQEGGTSFLKSAGTSAIVSPLKGASVFETFREKVVDKGLREEIDRQFERAKNPVRPNDRTLAVRDLRRIANLYLGQDERKELWDIAGKLDKGEVPEEELKKQAEEKLPFYVPPKMPSERGPYKVGERIEKFLEKHLPTTKGYEDTLGVQVGGAIGSTAGSIAQSMVGGPATLMAGSALQGIEEQFDRAKQSGLKEDDAINYAMQGAGPGVLGTLSAEYILRKLPPKIRNTLVRSVVDVGLAGGAEAVTEGLQQTIQNQIEMQYNKERKLFDGTPFAAAMGGSAGVVLRGVILGATRGRGSRADGGPVDYLDVQQQLAAEEFKARQSGVASAETQEPGKEPERAATPAEAAKAGEVKEPGRPATVVYGDNERVQGYVRRDLPDGGYEFVDRDGVVSFIKPEDMQVAEGEKIPAIRAVSEGWKQSKSDADIEKDLKQWLEGDNPWPKVTVETVEGYKYKAVEGPPDAAGRRTFYDGNARLHSADPGSIEVVGGWSEDALEAPPIDGEVDKAVSTVGQVTPEDVASALPTDLIALGRKTEAEATGTIKANEILSTAGLQPIGTPVTLKGDDDKAEKAVIKDAADGTVEILTDSGVRKAVKTEDFASKIAQIDVNADTSTKGGALPDIGLPAFLGPDGKFVRNIGPKTEGKPAKLEYKSPVEAAINDQREGQQGGTGVQKGQGAGDQAKQQGRQAQAAPSRVRNPEVKRTPEKGKVDVRQDEGQDERQGEKPRAESAPTGRAEVQNVERRGPASTNAVNEGQNAPRVRAQDVGDQPQAAPARQATTKEVATPLVSEPESTAKPVSPAQQGADAETAGWWDNASETERRTSILKAGFSELAQRQAYAKKSWNELAPRAKESISSRNADAIGAYASQAKTKATPEITVEAAKAQGMEVRKSGAPYASPKDALLLYTEGTHEAVKVEGGYAVRKLDASTDVVPETAIEPVKEPTQAKVKPLKQAPAYVKKNEFYLNKDGKGFRTKTEATSVAIKLGGAKSGLTVGQDAVTENRGWVVKQEPVKAVAEAPPAPTKAEQAKTPSQRRIPKKEYEAKRASVNASLRQELDKFGLKDVKLSTPISITDSEGKKSSTADTNVGRSVDGLIEVALSGDHDYRKTLRHEAVHSMRNLGLFKDTEWKVLERDARSDRALMEDVRDRYAGEGLTDESIVEEAIADKFSDFNDGVSKPKGFIRTAFEKIRNFIQSLGNALRRNGFQSASDVFQSIERGEVGARPRIETARQVAYSELQADTALKELSDPTAGLLPIAKYAKVRRHEDKIVSDMGWARRHLISPRTIAALSRTFTPVYVVAKRQFAFRDHLISDLATEYKPYRKLKSAGKIKLNKVLELGRLQQTVYQPNANGEISVTAARKTGAMAAGETVTLDAREVEAYQSVRSMMDKALDAFRDQTIRDFGYDPQQVSTPTQVLGLIQPGMGIAEAKKIRNLSKILTDIKQSKRTGYVPFSRFGNFVVVAEHINPATGKSTTLHSETVNVTGISGAITKAAAGWDISRLPEVKRIVDELRQRYPGADIRHFQVASQKDNRPEGERDRLSELLQLPPADLQEAIQKLHTDALAKGFRKHFLGAKNTPGYSIDLERSMADYVITLGGFIARRNSHKEWMDAIDGIPDNKPKEKQYARDYQAYTNTPAEEYAAVRQAGFVMMLMGNTSNAVANATQVPLISAPYMNMFSNSARVTFELGRAYKDVATMLGGGVDNMFNPDKAPADVRADLQQAWADGLFSPLAMHDIIGVAYKSRPNARSLSAATKKTIDYLAIPQTGTERINRLVTYITAYRLANTTSPKFEKKARSILEGSELANKTVLNNFNPDAFARYLVDETQYDVGKVNRARVMRNMGAAIFQFKPFIAQTFELQYRLMTLHGLRGQKAFALMMAGLIASAGVWGLPLSDDAMAGLEWLLKKWDGVDRDIKASTRETLAEMTDSPFIAELMSNGLFRYLGVDMTNRVGLGKVVPRSAEEAAGIPFSLSLKGLQALSQIKEGQIILAASHVLPLMAKNLVEQWVWSNDGVRTALGDPVMTPEEITPANRVAKGLGFNPSVVANRREMEWSQTRAGKAVQELQTKYYRKLARSLNDAQNAADEDDDAEFEKQLDRVQELYQEISDHNDRALEADQIHKVIVINEAALKKRLAAERFGRGVVREATAPVKARQRQQELRDIYGDTR